MKLLNCFIFCLISLSLLKFCSANDHVNNSDFLLKALDNDPRFSVFTKGIKDSGLAKIFSKQTKIPRIVYAPTDTAFKNLPNSLSSVIESSDNIGIMRKLVRTHIFVGDMNSVGSEEKNDDLEVDGKLVRIYKTKDLYVKDMVVIGEQIRVGNSVIVPVDCVMYLQHSRDDARLASDVRSSYPLTTCCLFTEEEVTDFIDGLI